LTSGYLQNIAHSFRLFTCVDININATLSQKFPSPNSPSSFTLVHHYHHDIGEGVWGNLGRRLVRGSGRNIDHTELPAFDNHSGLGIELGMVLVHIVAHTLHVAHMGHAVDVLAGGQQEHERGQLGEHPGVQIEVLAWACEASAPPLRHPPYPLD